MTDYIDTFDIWSTKICDDYRKMKRVCFAWCKVKCMELKEAVCHNCSKGEEY